MALGLLVFRQVVVLCSLLLLGLAGCGGGSSQSGPSDGDWVIPTGSGAMYRAVHMGGNWGTNVESSRTLPAEYFEYLRDLNADWVGINVALHLEDSMDSTVERKTSAVRIPTFEDDVLVRMIRAFRKRGFHVYVTLAFELEEARIAVRPVKRWQLGDPFAPDEDAAISPANWPWAPGHADHDRFVGEFWRTYTEQAVHFARLLQAEGVELYSLGGETDRLFRTRSGGRWPNHFGNELKAMVQAVRAVYTGNLTYDMHYDAVKTRTYFGPGSDFLWQDLGLDVVGVSAYFELADSPPTAVMSVERLRDAWERIFDDHLAPLKARNPGRPILFTEFGYSDSVRSPFDAASDSFTPRIFADANGNGLDDGQETQANIYRAFFQVLARRPGIVEGAFLWDTMMADADTWAKSFGAMREFSIRAKLVESIVRATYAEWRK